MSDFLTEVYYSAVDALREMAAGMIGWGLVLVVVVLPLVMFAYFFMKRAAARRGVDLNVQWNWSEPPRASRPAATRNLPASDSQPGQTRPDLIDPLDRTRAVLHGVYSGLLVGVGTVLLAAALYTAMVATTANGLALVAFLLFFASAAAFSRLWSHNRQQRSSARLAKEVRSVVQAIEPHVSLIATEPQVGFMDHQAIERAQELSRQGAPLDTICREVSPEYGQWDPLQQKAFQKVIQAVLQHHSTGALPAPASGGSGTAPSK